MQTSSSTVYHQYISNIVLPLLLIVQLILVQNNETTTTTYAFVMNNIKHSTYSESRISRPSPCDRSNPSLRNVKPKTSLSHLLSVSSSQESVDPKEVSSNEKKKIGFYVHIPYCRKRCRYCDFAIIPIGNHISTFTSSLEATTTTPTTTTLTKQQIGFEQLNTNYTNAILNEIDVLIDSITTNKEYEGKQIHLDSIYFGGGTPSLAPVSTIRLILQHILGRKQLSPKSINTVSINTSRSAIESQSFLQEKNDGIFCNSNTTEITMEMDPGTFTIQQLQSLKDLGINRISLGVQSFNDTILDSIGRIHTAQDIYDSVDMIANVFSNNNEVEQRQQDESNNAENDEDNTKDVDVNYSIDLISGLPGLDRTLWIDTLQRALDLNPQPKHLSIYDLQIESGTVFGSWYEDEILRREQEEDEEDKYNDDDVDESLKRVERQKSSKALSTNPATDMVDTKRRYDNNNLQLPLPSADDCAFMYTHASEFLRSRGFEHYEISSYAKISSSNGTNNEQNHSFRSQHNQIYWDIRGEWYAIGLGATSCIKGRRYARPRMMSDYIEWTQKCLLKQRLSKQNDNILPEWLDDDESWLHDLEDTIMTRLRTKDGLDLKWIAQQNNGERLLKSVLHGASFGLDLGLVKRDIDDVKGTDILYLVDPKGFLFSNTIISSIFAELP